MIIVKDIPPLFDKIDAKFSVKGKPVIFSWGDKIYNPAGIFVSPELIAHEEVHGYRQGNKQEHIVAWWEKYMEDPAFRMEEELPAHKAEYDKFCDRFKDRNKRAVFLNSVAGKLASPLYGSLISQKQALRVIMLLR